MDSQLEEIEYELVPPDGGWGWIILAGSMLINILIPGTIKSFGVLFIEFLEAFHASPSAAAWIPALCYFLYSSLGPLSSILSIKYSYRTVTILGGAAASLGMITSFWASSVTYLYLSYGVLVGIGAGLSFPPTVYIVTSYFVRLRGLANGLCISGSALGSIILPPILRWLLDIYGYRGAILLMGGVTLNVFVAAIFYEPVEKHMIRIPKKKVPLNSIEEEDIGIVLTFEKCNESSADAEAFEKEECIKKKRLPFYTPSSPTTNAHNDLHDVNHIINRSASAAVVQSYNKNQEFNTKTRKFSAIREVPSRNKTFTASQLHSQNSLHGVSDGPGSNFNQFRSQTYSFRNRLPRRTHSTSSFQYISTPYHGSTLSFQPKEFSSHLSLKAAANSPLRNNADAARRKEREELDAKRSKFFDLSLLWDPIYLIILISNSTNAIGYTNFIILLPAYGVDLGFDKSLSAYLISIVSVTDLIGRIGGSALSDLEIIPKVWYFTGGLLISGISLALLPFVTSYTMVAFWCSVFGLASGAYVGVTAIIMADMLGTERLTSSYGISLFVNGILQLIGPPLCGIWYEAVQGYDYLFHTLGIILFLGGAMWIFVPCFKPKVPIVK